MSIEAIGAPAPAALDVSLPAESSKPLGLHSPPESNNAMDVDASDSELSDLDEVAFKLNGALGDESTDEAKEESKDELIPEPKVEPNDESKDGPKDEPEHEPQPVPEDIGEVLPDHWSGNVPVFKPTMKQFKDFKLFVCRLSLAPIQPLSSAD
jgi:hypothetical protein